MAFATVVGLGMADGGYFPDAWAWSLLAFAWLVTLVLLVGAPRRPKAAALVFAGGLASFCGWVWLSTLWSGSVPRSIADGQRALVYVTAGVALVLLLREVLTAPLLGGVLAAVAVISAYGLATRLFPDRYGRFDSVAEYRLAEPIGYWNGLGLLAAIGIFLALGFAAHGRRTAVRAVAFATFPVLGTTLYFTYSRGAMIALGLGLAAAFAFEHARLRLLTSALLAAVLGGASVWAASRAEALTSRGAALADATREGHRLAVVVLLLVAAGTVAGTVLSVLDRRVRVGARVRLAVGVTLAAAAVAGVVAGLVRFGDPVDLSRTAYESFTAPTHEPTSDLDRRLFSLWGNGRPQMWRVAWDSFGDEPVLGSGAGTFEAHWFQDRPIALKVRDAHSLYIETLAELGIVGLVLLVTALAAPLVAAARRRSRQPFVGVAAGAYVAYLAEAGVDWQWELPAVSLAGLAAGATLVVSVEPEALSRTVVRAGLAFALPLCALAVVFVIGNGALQTADRALRDGEWAHAEREARRAVRWGPWSSEARRMLGEALLAQGDFDAARGALRSAVDRDPQNWRLWFDLARASAGEEQRRVLARAAMLNPRGREIEELRAEIRAGRRLDDEIRT